MAKVRKPKNNKEEKLFLSALEQLEIKLDYLEEINHVKEKEERLETIKYILKVIENKENLKAFVCKNLDKVFKMIEINIFEHAIDSSRYKIPFKNNQVGLILITSLN